MTNEDLIEYLKSLGFKSANSLSGNRSHFQYYYIHPIGTQSKCSYSYFTGDYTLSFETVRNGLLLNDTITWIKTPDHVKELIELNKHFIFS